MTDAKAVVEQWLDAMEKKDAEGALDVLADDVKMWTEALEGPIVGKEQLRGSMRSFLEACESIRIERLKVVVSGSDAAILARTSARLRSDVEVLGERLPTAGKHVRAMGALFVTVNERGKIAEVSRVRDTWQIMRQLGLSPERFQTLLQKVQRETAAPPPS